MKPSRLAVPVSIVHTPFDLWVAVGTFASLIAVVIALLTVMQNKKALKEVQNQTLVLIQQTDQLQQALMRPAVRVSRSQGAIQAIQGVKSSPFWNLSPHFFIALTNIGLGRAVNIDVRVMNQGITLYRMGETRFLISSEDYHVIGFRLDESQNLNEGFVTIETFYEDILGHKYRYLCNLRFAGSIAVPAEEKDELVDD